MPIKIIEKSTKELEERKLDYKEAGKKIFLIKSEVNRKFGGGNNIGIKFAMNYLKPDYILLLNNDTVVEENFLNELIHAANNLDRIGILSPFVYYYENPKTIQHGGEKVRTIRAESEKLWKNHPEKKIIETETAAGPCMLISKEAIIKAGLLPKECEFLLTDVCYSFKVRQNGFRIFSIRNSLIWHKGSVSLNKVKEKTLKFQVKEGINFHYYYMDKKRFLARMIINVAVYYPYMCVKSVYINRNFKGTKAVFEGIYEAIIQIKN